MLVDLNVILDVLLDRRPFVETSAALWALVEEGKVEGWIAAHGVTTIFYLVAKEKGREAARAVVRDLLSVFAVAPVDQAALRRAALLDCPDFEDAVSAAAAEASACDAVVTRDRDGFAGSPIEPIDPLVAVAMLTGEVHESGGRFG